jgi:hypothetical protein
MKRLPLRLFYSLSMALATTASFSVLQAFADEAENALPAISLDKTGEAKDALNNRATAAEAQVQNTVEATKGQSINSCTITGTVVELGSQRTIEDARLVLTRVGEEHKRYLTESNKDGVFIFKDVDPGEWTLTTQAKEMLSHTITVKAEGGETKQVKVALEELEPVDVLRVTGKRTLIHPDKIGSTTNIDHRFIQEYRTGNDLRQLVESTPGVMNDSYGNVITRGEHNAINYELDGVVIPEAAGVLQQSQPVSPRSLQSAQVDIGGYEAQDGGGPLGAVVRMKSLPILNKPNFTIGQQLGGPLAGSIYYNGSARLSQNEKSPLHKWAIESSGSFRGTSLRLGPPVKYFAGNAGADINVLTRIEYYATERDLFRLTAAINESFLQVPTSGFARGVGVRQHQHDRQDYIILSYRHRFEKFFEEANLHLLNGFYYDSFSSTNAFDPTPDFNADQPLFSLAARAKRFNYIFSAQGDISKRLMKTHHLKAGFLDEVRPVSTKFSGTYFNADYIGTLQAQAAANAERQQLLSSGDTVGAAAVQNPTPFGAVISPFTGQPGGPAFSGNIGHYTGFRWLQSAYFQDRWKPEHGWGKRFTIDAGVRFDLQHSVFGNAMGIAKALQTIPGIEPFKLEPFGSQRLTNAQASGRFGIAYVLGKDTVVRGSFSNIFTPTPVDYFLTPFLVTGVSTVGGIYPGTPRPLPATRGSLVDASIEKQFGPRFVGRTNLFYKNLTNFGDSGVIGNLPIYNRLTNSGQVAYGVETRMDLKGSRDGYGFNGFVSNTVQWAFLTGSHGVSGGFYDFPQPPLPRYPDHDRRFQNVCGLGYRSRKNWWFLADLQTMTGLQDSRDPELYGPHPTRTPFLTLLGFSGGYQIPQKVHAKHPHWPSSFDVRIENALNQRLPTNLGSPFQGTRFTLPIRVLAGCSWMFGRDISKLADQKDGRATPQPTSTMSNSAKSKTI